MTCYLRKLDIRFNKIINYEYKNNHERKIKTVLYLNISINKVIKISCINRAHFVAIVFSAVA